MNDHQADVLPWKNVPLIDYMNACDDYASGRYAIDSSDLGIDEKMMADAQEALESPKELIEFYAKKYDLKPYDRSKIDVHTMLKARRQTGASSKPVVKPVLSGRSKTFKVITLISTMFRLCRDFNSGRIGTPATMALCSRDLMA